MKRKEESGGGGAGAKFPLRKKRENAEMREREWRRSRRKIPLKVKRVWNCSVPGVVGERSIRGEVRAEALVDIMEVRMPE